MSPVLATFLFVNDLCEGVNRVYNTGMFFENDFCSLEAITFI